MVINRNERLFENQQGPASIYTVWS